MRTATAELEQSQRRIEKDSWQEVVTQFWTFANSLIQLVPLFRKGLTEKGLSASQYMWTALVSIVIVFCAVMAVLIFSAGLEVVCLVRGQESCAALGFHRRALASMGVANQTCAAATVTASALGYHGPFGEVMIAAMPGEAPVALGFWSRPMPRGEADASAFCTSAVAAIDEGHNTGAMPALQMDADKNCQRCIQGEAGPFRPSQIMTCLAPIQCQGYNL